MVALVILFFAVLGVVGVVSPATVLELTGTEGASPGARSEARAVYGGGALAIAGLLSAAPWMDGGDAIRWGIGVALFATGAARAVGLIVDWPRALVPVIAVALELAAAAILLT